MTPFYNFSFSLKIKVILLILISLVSFNNKTFSENITISGSDSSYINEELVFYTYTDYITQNEKELCRFKVNVDGSFSCSFDIKETIQAYVFLYAFKGLIYFEPNRNYEIILPPKTLKTPEEEYNPYFKEYEVYLGVSNYDENELNYLIKKFDKIYDTFQKLVFFNQKGYNKKDKIDTVLLKIDKIFTDNKNTYFNDYKEYKYAYLYFLISRNNPKFIVKEYFLNKPFLYNNSAYMYLFNQVFSNYFSAYSQTKDGENIVNDIVLSKSIVRLKKSLSKNISLANDTLQELVILKGLHDAFYSGRIGELSNFPKPQLFQTLDSIKILTKVPIHNYIAKNIKIKADYLMPGTNAPFFQLRDIYNNIKTNADFNGKYIYLHFVASWSYPSLNDFDLLNKFKLKYSDEVEIVTIFADKDTSVINFFLNKHDYNWIFLYCKDNSDVLKRYNVKSFPTYFLIDPNGNLVFSPAQGITEHFDKTFNQILKNN